MAALQTQYQPLRGSGMHLKEHSISALQLNGAALGRLSNTNAFTKERGMAKRRFFACALIMTIALLLASPSLSRAEIALMDGKLILSGFVKNTTYYRLNGYDREFNKGRGLGVNHDTKFDFSNFSALFEALYTIKEDQQGALRVFSSFKGWYEASSRYDDLNRRNLYTEDRKEYQLPQSLEDVIAEMYIDYSNGPWQVRAGKQIVIWGQLDMNRVADVVNPLDLRWGAPGIDTWEEVKRGLWLIRTFYQSQLPGNLLFEFILNPGDYKAFKLPYEGTHWGAEFFQNRPDAFAAVRDRGFFSWLQEKWRDDEPTQWALDNYEFGGRVQGFTYNVDWTLLYWNAKSDGPTSVDVENSIQHANLYFDTFSPLPGQPGYEVFKYKRYSTIGGTAQTFTTGDKTLKDTVWRLEWFLEIGSPLVKGLRGNTNGLYDTTRRNILGIALQGNWYWRIPWFTAAVGKGQQMQTSLTWFNERIVNNYDKDLCLADRFYKPGSRTMDSFTLFIMQQMFNASWTFVAINSYYPHIGKWMSVPSFTYMFPDSGPFSGFRFDIGVKIYGGAKHKYSSEEGGNALSHVFDKKDSVILRLRYEF